ncbi:MAG TPA: hypothetical protein VLT90_11855 [Terriglobales bacterium]|nr:hypothetical protein [Terriglobales bacterium]
MMKKTRQRKGIGWKKIGAIVVTLTAAVSLYQQAEHAVITTVRDISFLRCDRDPVTYAELEGLRVKPEWSTRIVKPSNFPDLN